MIAFETQQEACTSKCSFLDKEFPGKKKAGEYQGSSTQRGLFKSREGTIINADINGAANILVKYLKRQGSVRRGTPTTSRKLVWVL